MSKNSRVFCTLTFDFLHLVIAIAIMVISIKFHEDVTEEPKGPIKLFTKDLESPAGFTDIQVVKVSSSGDVECPSGYQVITKYQWKGTSSGCYCNSLFWETISPYSCTIDEQKKTATM